MRVGDIAPVCMCLLNEQIEHVTDLDENDTDICPYCGYYVKYMPIKPDFLVKKERYK